MRQHLFVVLAVFVFSVLVFTQAQNLGSIWKVDTQYAAGCAGPYTISPPANKPATIQCLQTGTQIYSEDTRFNFFVVPPALANTTFIQSENLSLKDLTTLSWSIQVSSPSQVYILYRKIPGQSIPAWLRGYTKVTNDDFSNLNQFVLRKNDQGLIGVYDIYARSSTATGTVPLGPASDSNVQAYSMYIVAVKNVATSSPLATPTKSPTPTNSPTSSPSPTPPAGGGSLPSQVLNLTNWKITLPEPVGQQISPTEIKQPQLANYTDQWFKVTPQKDGVIFRAPVNGAHTSGSSYPRSELREMINNGLGQAAWSNSSGVHTMAIDQAITAVPQTKKHVVAGQIHDASDDVIVIRLELPNLYVNVGTNPPGGNQHVATLDANYTLGKRFTVKFEATGGKTNIYYNGAPIPAYTLTRSYSGAYFKTGAYTQSNCSTETSGACVASNYGEVVVYRATVTHQ